MTNVIDTLKNRGLIHNTSDEAGLRRLLEAGRPVRPYLGFDPSAPSLHLGNLVPIMAQSHFDQAGHEPIFLVGGATGQIGDPTGKHAQRVVLSKDEVRKNLAAIQAQLTRFVNFERGAIMVDNDDWLSKLGFMDFLRDIAIHFNVNQMLHADSNKSRLQAGGLSLTEMIYGPMQAIDFLHLHREFDCCLQVGGSDQWSNSLAGVDLIRKVDGHRAYVLSTPLITTASGAKMGKTESGAVWLDPSRTSPFEYFHFWINVEDADVDRFLKLFTFLPLRRIAELAELQGADLREAKKVLAVEATTIVHGAEAAQAAVSASEAVFDGDTTTVDFVPAISVSCSSAQLVSVSDLLVKGGVATSARAARRLIDQGGVSINGVRVDDSAASVELEQANGAILRAGKRQIRRIEVVA